MDIQVITRRVILLYSSQRYGNNDLMHTPLALVCTSAIVFTVRCIVLLLHLLCSLQVAWCHSCYITQLRQEPNGKRPLQLPTGIASFGNDWQNCVVLIALKHPPMVTHSFQSTIMTDTSSRTVVKLCAMRVSRLLNSKFMSKWTFGPYVCSVVFEEERVDSQKP